MLFSAQKFDKGMVSGIPLCRKSELKLVPNFPIKLLQLANQPLASSSSLQGKIRTGLCARFSAEWSNAECG